MKAGLNQTEIANIIGVNKLSISRKLSCNKGLRGYRPQQAHQLSLEWQAQKAHPLILVPTWKRVENLLRQLP